VKSGAGDRGSASVVAMAVIAVLAVALVVACELAAVAVARHRAASAADLAAVAAASAWPLPAAEACARADAIATANGAHLVDCSTAGPAVQVTVAVRLRTSRVAAASVRGTARAARGGGP
jgi:secretion/DNA translocation related TadE-like protein